QRDQHLRFHERAFKCTEENCDYLTIGFPTKAELARHNEVCHVLPPNDYEIPQVKSISLENALNNAIDKNDKFAVRELCTKLSGHPTKTGFLFRAVQRTRFDAAFILLGFLGSSEIHYKSKGNRTVLHEIVNKMHLGLLEKILTTDIDVNTKDSSERTALTIALEHKFFDAARLLWDRTEQPRLVGNFQSMRIWRTAFVAAASGGHNDIMQSIFMTLIENTDSFQNIVKRERLSISVSQALTRAAANNHESTVKTILEIGAQTYFEKHYTQRLKKSIPKGIEAIKQLERPPRPEVDGNGRTKGNALAKAARKDDEQTVLRLLESGADVNYCKGGFVNTALGSAAENGKLSMVRLLLARGANVDVQPRCGGSPLAMASGKGHYYIVQVLLDNGADVNAQDNFSCTALIRASEGGYGNIVQMLLNNRANVNAHGGSALLRASAGGYDNIVQMLLNNGADVNARDTSNSTALIGASKGGHDNIVQMLLDNGADVNARDTSSSTALIGASKGGYGNIVQILLDNGANVNTQDIFDSTALILASEGGYGNIVQMLLDNRADVNAQGGSYGSALIGASVRGHGGVVQILLDNGADVNAQGAFYRSPLHAALSAGHNNVAMILRARGADERADNNAPKPDSGNSFIGRLI
ncbi:MAG: hypothetical protein Q9214_005984, partial [Letrouitia sp. 1 TL-2023]